MVSEFIVEPQFYQQNNPDLLPAGIDTPEELLTHWQLFGRFEERASSPYYEGLLELVQNRSIREPIDFVREFFSANATINIEGDPKRLPFAGEFVGFEEIARYIEQLEGTIFLEDLQPLEFIEEGNKLALRLREEGTAENTGEDYLRDVVQIITTDTNGLITSIESFSNTYPVNEAIAGLTPTPVDPQDLVGVPLSIDGTVNSEETRQIGINFWEGITSANPNSGFDLLANDVVWSFASGSGDFLPYSGVFNGSDPTFQSGAQGSIGILAGIVSSSNITVDETFATGNRVLVKLIEKDSIIRGSGNPLNIDLLSWITVENGEITAVETVADTNLVVQGLRPETRATQGSPGLYPLPTEARRVFDNPNFLVPSNVDPNGVFGSDEGDSFAIFDFNGNFLGFWNQFPGTDNPQDGIGDTTFGVNGNLLATSPNNDAILEYDGLTGQFVGAFVDGSAEGNELDVPVGVTLGPDNDLYVSSSGTEQVLKYDGLTGQFIGVFAEGDQTDNIQERFTEVGFGPDGNLYVGVNPELGDPTFGQAEVRVYSGVTGKLIHRITGLDFAASLEFAPNGLLYVSDDPSSVLDVSDPNNPIPVDPAKSGRILVYETPEELVGQFSVGVGNAGNVAIGPDNLIYVSNPGAGTVTGYNETGTPLQTIEIPATTGGLGRPTGAIFFTPNLLSPILQESEALPVG